MSRTPHTARACAGPVTPAPRFPLLFLFAFLFPAAAAPAAGPAARAAETAKTWTLTLRDVDIRAFLEQISSITGENFVVDPQVTGRVSVIATTPMSPNAVHELFLTVLRVNGFAAVPAGAVTRIVPLAHARGGSGGGAADSRQQLVTRVIPAGNVHIDEAVKLLKPLVSPAGFLEGSAYSSALVVSDYADNVEQIIRALEGLGRDAPAEVEIIPLREGWVGNIVPLLEMMGPGPLSDAGRSRNRLRVMADERSNSIIVRGNALERAQLRQLVRQLDKKSPHSQDIQLFRLRNSDAKAMAALLRGIVLGQKTSLPAAGDGATPGALSPAPAAPAVPAAPTGAAAAAEATPGFIMADTSINAVVVRAEPSVMSNIGAVIRQLDVRRPQVMIEAAIVEITMDKANRLGVQLGGGDLTRSIRSGTTNFTDPSGVSLSLGAFLEDLGNTVTPGEGLVVSLGTRGRFDILLQALARTAGANLLSTPSITTLDNEEAKIVVGQNVPFRTGSFSTLNAGVSNPFTTIERQDIGLTLKVVPQIHGGNLVKLSIEQEVSSLAETQLGTAADLITNKRTIHTKVMAQDGETVILGGLIQDDAREGVSQVPVLGDIPVLGTLFRHTRQDAVKRNLFVFLRPSVLPDSGAAEAATQTQYARVYGLYMRHRAHDDDAGEAKHAARETHPLSSLPGYMEQEAEQTPAAETVFDAPPQRLPGLLE